MCLAQITKTYIYSLKFIALSKHILVTWCKYTADIGKIRCTADSGKSDAFMNRVAAQTGQQLKIISYFYHWSNSKCFSDYSHIYSWYKQITGSESGMDTLLKWIHMKKLSPLCGAYFNTSNKSGATKLDLKKAHNKLVIIKKKEKKCIIFLTDKGNQSHVSC